MTKLGEICTQNLRNSRHSRLTRTSGRSTLNESCCSGLVIGYSTRTNIVVAYVEHPRRDDLPHVRLDVVLEEKVGRRRHVAVLLVEEVAKQAIVVQHIVMLEGSSSHLRTVLHAQQLHRDGRGDRDVFEHEVPAHQFQLGDLI